MLATLAGCDYSVTVRNDSRKTVLAEVRHDRFLAPTSRPDSAMLEPGDAADFGPFKIDPLEPIHLRVRIVGDTFGGWQEERLEPGNQTMVVDDGTLQSWEAVSLRRESASDRRGSAGERADDGSDDRSGDRAGDRAGNGGNQPPESEED